MLHFFRLITIKPVEDHSSSLHDAVFQPICAELKAEDDLELEVARVYDGYATGLLRYALVTIRNREAAQDAVQEVFLRYFISRSQGLTIQTPKAWLFRVLRNYLLDCLKSSTANREIGIESVQPIVDDQQDPEVSYHHRELARQVCTLLAPRELECLRLRNEGFGYEEIADILSVRSGTVAALLARGQKKIRKALDQPVRGVPPQLVENPC